MSDQSNAVATVGAASIPAWISSLSTSSIAADTTAADVNGVVSEAGLTKLLTDLCSTLSTSTLTSAEFADLKTIAANLNNGLSTSSYLTYVFNALVNGNAANATWTGGGAASVSLGNLAVGANATQLSELTGKWLLGTDLPSSKVTLDDGSSYFSISYSTVTNALFAASGPSMSDINQGYLGDCYFLSSCAEVAHFDAADIASMFTNNGNGTYGVRLYVDGVAKYVTVNASLADGGSAFNDATDIWASLAEKAFAQLQAGGLDTGNSINYGNSYSTIGNGGLPANALEALTGCSAFVDYCADGASWSAYDQNASMVYTGETSGESTASVLNTLIADLSLHDDLILGSYTDATDASGKTTLVADHAMSIYGYDSTTGDLEVRNPWGTVAGQYWDTTFEVSLSTILADGDMITADNAGVSGSLVGGGQTVYLNSTTSNFASLYNTAGDWDTVYGSNGQVNLTQAQANIVGAADTLYLDGSTSDAVSLSETNNAWDWVNGSNGRIDLSNAQVTVVGGGDTMNLGGDGDAVSLVDTNNNWDWVSGSNGRIDLTDAQTTLVGGGDTINLGSGGYAVSLVDTNNNWDWVNGSNGRIDLTDAQTTVVGGGDTINFGSGGYAVSFVDTNNNWDLVNGSNGRIDLTDAQTTVVGGGDTINFGSDGDAVSLSSTNNDWDWVNGSNGRIDLVNAQASLFGSGDIFNLSGANTIGLQADFGFETINGFASSDTLLLSASDQGLLTVAQFGANTTIALDSNDVITLAGVQASVVSAAIRY